MKIRVYGKTLNKWEYEDEHRRPIVNQIEVAYKEYDVETGELVGVGSEDFSPKRYFGETELRFVYTWDGERRNKGGKRWFDYRGNIRFRKSEKAAVKRYLMNKYKVDVLQMRG